MKMSLGPNQVFPDESLHSFLLRNAIDRMQGVKSDILRQLTKNEIEWRPIPKLSDTSLTFFNEHYTKRELFDIVGNTCPINNVKPFVKPAQLSRLSKYIFNPSEKESIDDFMYYALVSKKFKIRYCEDCFVEQISNFGTTYFKKQWYEGSKCLIHNNSYRVFSFNARCDCKLTKLQKFTSFFRGFCVKCQKILIPVNEKPNQTLQPEMDISGFNYFTPCATVHSLTYFFEMVFPRMLNSSSHYSEQLVKEGNYLNKNYHDYRRRNMNFGWRTYARLFRFLLKVDESGFTSFLEEKTGHFIYHPSNQIAVDVSYSTGNDRNIEGNGEVSCRNCQFFDDKCQLDVLIDNGGVETDLEIDVPLLERTNLMSF